MGKCIAIVNQKGGVGKTTTCVNLAAALTDQGAKVLVCDFDPQGNATSGLGVEKSRSPSVYDVIPANKSLSGATVELIAMDKREYRLRDTLASVKNNYDFIFIDCPPSLELLTLDALCAADTLLVPVQCEYFALEGLSDLMYTMRLAKRSLNPSLELEGVVLTMYDGRTNLSMQVAEEVKRYFPAKVYASVIPRNVRLSEAPSHGKPISAYDRLCRGAEAYEGLAREFLGKNHK